MVVKKSFFVKDFLRLVSCCDRLSKTQKLILSVLLNNDCFMTSEMIARELNMYSPKGINTIRPRLTELKNLGLVVVNHKSRPYDSRCQNYFWVVSYRGLDLFFLGVDSFEVLN